jgi:CspA family cold shock protein
MPRALSRAATSFGVDMLTGTVKFFNGIKGFGFIQPDDGSKDVFVHISAVEQAGLGTLTEKQRVSFELQKGNNGKTSASNLKAI